MDLLDEVRVTMDEDVLPFRVESESEHNFERGFGHSGKKTKIKEWASLGGYERCPGCGYDRVKEVNDYSPEDSETDYYCQACGLHKESFEQEQERLREERREWEERLEERREKRRRRSRHRAITRALGKM